MQEMSTEMQQVHVRSQILEQAEQLQLPSFRLSSYRVQAVYDDKRVLTIIACSSCSSVRILYDNRGRRTRLPEAATFTGVLFMSVALCPAAVFMRTVTVSVQCMLADIRPSLFQWRIQRGGGRTGCTNS